MSAIGRVAVIGSGVMGGGIAAQAANAGLPVLLFDVSRDVAAAAIPRLVKTGAFMVPANASRLTPLGIEGDMGALRDCDWIIEAVVENLAVKQDLYRRIEAIRHGRAIVSSNTSTIRLADLAAGLTEEFRRHFLVTHFFNPPRLMRLLEIVKGADTSPHVVDAIADVADRQLGKTVVHCKDRPGFIANRLGCYWMQAALVEAVAQGLDVEDADAVMGQPFGIPKTGVFGLADLVGIDLLPRVNASLAAALEPTDPFQAVNVPLPRVDDMIANGLTGRKGKGGFYRLNRAAGKRMEAIDLRSGEYRAARAVSIETSEPLLRQDNAHGRYARAVMLKTLTYAAQLLGDAADDIASIDAAMRLGYNWAWGPFELIDRIGLAEVKALARAEGLAIAPWLAAATGPLYRDGEALRRDGSYAPLPKARGILALRDIRRKAQPIIASGSAALWDLGDGVACFEITTPRAVLDRAALALLDEAIDVVARHHRALVIYSDAPDFSTGIDPGWLAAACGESDAMTQLIDAGTRVFAKLRAAAFPSVAAVCGAARGAGCALQMLCSATQAHAESTIGFTEAGLGLLPLWGGWCELLHRLQQDVAAPKGPMPPIQRAFELLALATVSTSAADARRLGLLRPSDGITMNRDRLLADAREAALALAGNYTPPELLSLRLPGPSAMVPLMLAAQSAVSLGKATPHDLEIAMALAGVLAGGSTDITRPLGPGELSRLASTANLALARSPLTQARIRHMAETGKPLRT